MKMKMNNKNTPKNITTDNVIAVNFPGRKKAKLQPKDLPAIRSRPEAEAAVREIAAMKLEEAKASAEMDTEMRLVEEKYAGHLSKLREAMETKIEQVRAWADANPEEFRERRSVELPDAVFGWRLGQPTIKTVSGWTWEAVLQGMLANPLWSEYIRTKQEVNKLRLLADRVALGEEVLGGAGLRVAQEESFFVEPKLETTSVEKRVAA